MTVILFQEMGAVQLVLSNHLIHVLDLQVCVIQSVGMVMFFHQKIVMTDQMMGLDAPLAATMDQLQVGIVLKDQQLLLQSVTLSAEMV